MRSANLVLAFLIELAAFAAFACWGTSLSGGLGGIFAAMLAASVAIALWAVFAAPRSARRLPLRPRVVFEFGVFVLAACALLASGHGSLAIVLGVASLLHALARIALGQGN